MRWAKKEKYVGRRAQLVVDPAEVPKTAAGAAPLQQAVVTTFEAAAAPAHVIAGLSGDSQPARTV